MPESRNVETIWQQGFVLNADSAVKMGLIDSEDKAKRIALVISHDCDLVESDDIEPNCEIIIGRTIEKVDGTFAAAKNPRRLHLSFSAGKNKLAAEFVATDKQQLKKSLFLTEKPDDEIRLSQSEHFALQSWLSVRYHRPIFPDEFDNRLRAKPSEVHKRLASAIKATGNDLIMVLFDIDAGKEMNHNGADDPYILDIYLLYNVSEDPSRAEATAKKAAQSIRGIFRAYYYKGSRWQNIQLRDCLPISEDALSMYKWRLLKPWHFDYLSVLAEERKAD
jgi:hypothetical protein